ncbi:hypothetical protein [Cognatishimia sp. MH4019]|uniref:hypothetical protein n=1 Tax=Cognatishimia sp. MH4019 TaxID=2854030 RepID=UPI001CD68C9E|nr:hypothetical protein [Cognatishimia sp. MH4019]
MERLLKKFASDDAGNASVDWMVLSAGLVFLGVAVAISIGTSTGEVASSTTENIDAIDPSELVKEITS